MFEVETRQNRPPGTINDTNRYDKKSCLIPINSKDVKADYSQFNTLCFAAVLLHSHPDSPDKMVVLKRHPVRLFFACQFRNQDCSKMLKHPTNKCFDQSLNLFNPINGLIRRN